MTFGEFLKHSCTLLLAWWNDTINLKWNLLTKRQSNNHSQPFNLHRLLRACQPYIQLVATVAYLSILKTVCKSFVWCDLSGGFAGLVVVSPFLTMLTFFGSSVLKIALQANHWPNQHRSLLYSFMYSHKSYKSAKRISNLQLGA